MVYCSRLGSSIALSRRSISSFTFPTKSSDWFCIGLNIQRHCWRRSQHVRNPAERRRKLWQIASRLFGFSWPFIGCSLYDWYSLVELDLCRLKLLGFDFCPYLYQERWQPTRTSGATIANSCHLNFWIMILICIYLAQCETPTCKLQTPFRLGSCIICMTLNFIIRKLAATWKLQPTFCKRLHDLYKILIRCI